MFGGNFAPRGWAFCDGQLLAISSNQALFSILGTTYGGDGRTTFALPDLRGRVSIHPGSGPGLSTYKLGERGGHESVVLNPTNVPTHTHPATSTAVSTVTHDLSLKTSDDPESKNPIGNVHGSDLQNVFGAPADPVTTMAAGAVTGDVTVATSVTTTVDNNVGGGLPHDNIQPFECVNYIIALLGIFPPRS